MLRPLVVWFEGSFTNNIQIVVTIMPMSMLLLTLSSIPVHIDYYKCRNKNNEFEKGYLSALLIIICITLLLVVVINMVSYKILNVSILILSGAFLIEKLSDEISRKLEFTKKFKHWIIVQLLRTSWYLVGTFLVFIGYDTMAAFFYSCTVTIIFLIIYFFIIIKPKEIRIQTGIITIKSNFLFALNGITPALIQHFPRVLFTRFYSDNAHLFLFFSQLCQGFGFLYYTKFQMRYRKAISLKPKLFGSRLSKLNMQIIKCTLPPVLVITILMSIFFDASYDQAALMQKINLFLIILADSILCTLVYVYAGYFQWIFSQKQFLKVLSMGMLLTIIFFISIIYLNLTSFFDYWNVYILNVLAVSLMLTFLIRKFNQSLLIKF